MPKNKVAPQGHNAIAADQLRQYVERVDRLTDERNTINEDIKEVLSEAKGNGYDRAMVRHAVKLYRMESSDREEHIAIRNMYEGVLDLV